MNDSHEQSDRSFHNLLVQSLAQSRTVASSIRVNVLHVPKPTARIGAERLLRAIAAGRIFDLETLTEIEVLIERIAPLIEAETKVIDCWDNDPHNVSGPTSWTELRRTKNAEALRQTERALCRLMACISAVLDCRRARAEVF